MLFWDLRSKDKDKDLWSKDKDLKSEDKDKDLRLKDKSRTCKLVFEDPQGQGLSSRTTTLASTVHSTVFIFITVNTAHELPDYTIIK